MRLLMRPRRLVCRLAADEPSVAKAARPRGRPLPFRVGRRRWGSPNGWVVPGAGGGASRTSCARCLWVRVAAADGYGRVAAAWRDAIAGNTMRRVHSD